MNKLLKVLMIIFIVILVVVVIGAIFCGIDKSRISNNKRPIFCIDKSGGSVIHYVGLGYVIYGAYDDVPGGLENAKVYTWFNYKNNSQETINTSKYVEEPEIDIEYKVIFNGYDDYASGIISNYEEYRDLIEYIDIMNERYGVTYDLNPEDYTEGYFDYGSLALISIVTGSGMNKLKNIDVSIYGNTLVCDVDIDYNDGTVTDDINGKVLLVEVDKNITNIVINK